jgi:hypothetical protein
MRRWFGFESGADPNNGNAGSFELAGTSLLRATASDAAMRGTESLTVVCILVEIARVHYDLTSHKVNDRIRENPQLL